MIVSLALLCCQQTITCWIPQGLTLVQHTQTDKTHYTQTWTHNLKIYVDWYGYKQKHIYIDRYKTTQRPIAYTWKQIKTMCTTFFVFVFSFFIQHTHNTYNTLSHCQPPLVVQHFPNPISPPYFPIPILLIEITKHYLINGLKNCAYILVLNLLLIHLPPAKIFYLLVGGPCTYIHTFCLLVKVLSH